MRRAGDLRGRKFQQPFDGRHAHRVGEGVELLLGVHQQFQDRQKLLAAGGEEIGDDLLAVIGIGNVGFHRVVSLERVTKSNRILT